jgi:hypothetical protein
MRRSRIRLPHPWDKAWDAPIRAGEWEAEERAGTWPTSGTVEEYQAAVDRAVKAARRVANLQYRYNVRFHLWETFSGELSDNDEYLDARKHRAIRIAEEREWLFRRIYTQEARGSA